MKIVIIGAGGQLGRDLTAALITRGDEVAPLTRTDLDITDRAQTAAVLAGMRPELVINTAAENRVDACEDRLSEAFAVNAVAAGHLAAVTGELGAALLHLSTDYVFDGSKGAPYVESDPPAPLNAYGASKLAGEQLVRERNPRHFIIRSSGLYGAAGSKGKGGNFVEAIIRRAREESAVPVVNDQVTAPTYTRDLAEAIAELIRTRGFGTYHLAADGEVSWCGFAREIIKQLGLEAEARAITSAALGLRARRPAYSVLRSEELAPLRHWREALSAYLIEKGYEVQLRGASVGGNCGSWGR